VSFHHFEFGHVDGELDERPPVPVADARRTLLRIDRSDLHRHAPAVAVGPFHRAHGPALDPVRPALCPAAVLQRDRRPVGSGREQARVGGWAQDADYPPEQSGRRQRRIGDAGREAKIGAYQRRGQEELAARAEQVEARVLGRGDPRDAFPREAGFALPQRPVERRRVRLAQRRGLERRQLDRRVGGPRRGRRRGTGAGGGLSREDQAREKAPAARAGGGPRNPVRARDQKL